MEESSVTAVEAPSGKSGGPSRSVLAWIIAGIATLVAALAILAYVLEQASEPRPVAQLPQDPSVEGTFRVDEDVEFLDLTPADFVSHGSYGVLEVWSTTKPADKRCLAIVAEGRVSLFRCSAPTFDTIADFDIEPALVPPAPSGEPAANIRFVLHDDLVDVYLASNPAGGYY
ncbi:hypothetical protein [Microbacterium sp. BK668]|uniref:hypothetical protein n=1 Tax=Microbacterium sp. BK668 TaxID=2512118 RepID=UPI0010D2C768|nr:hypothetical protein [Microbacterium sp. BK668]TDN92294.1 hypothetical protein EV279_1813 [Microbacterium sp. BK668]